MRSSLRHEKCKRKGLPALLIGPRPFRDTHERVRPASLKATDFVVGSDVKYEINGDKGKLKNANGKQVECTIVRVAELPATAPPPAAPQ